MTNFIARKQDLDTKITEEDFHKSRSTSPLFFLFFFFFLKDRTLVKHWRTRGRPSAREEAWNEG